MSRTPRSLGLLFLLGSTAFAATDVAISAVHVNIRPALAARILGPEVSLKIRLAQGTEALVWKSETCNAAAAGAQAIEASGTYTFPVSDVPGEGTNICVRSSDRLLAARLAL